MLTHSPGRLCAATQKVRGFSSVMFAAGNESRVDDALTDFRYDSSIQPVNVSSVLDLAFVGSQCGKSPKRVSTNSCPSLSNPAGCNPMRRSKFQFTAIHGVPVFHQLP